MMKLFEINIHFTGFSNTQEKSKVLIQWEKIKLASNEEFSRIGASHECQIYIPIFVTKSLAGECWTLG